MGAILDEIREWAMGLPYWEQAALEKVTRGVSLTVTDYDELLGYLLEDAGLAKPCGPRPVLEFPQVADPTGADGPVRLQRLHALENVNALVPGQELHFAEQLTTVFGANGSGKSGYARVLASAAFSRGDKEVLPDIGSPDQRKPMTAQVDIVGASGPVTIPCRVGQPLKELRSFYVFDSTSVKSHLTKSNAMSFAPVGLSYLTRLAEVTDKVRERLQTQAEARQGVNPLLLAFPMGVVNAALRAGEPLSRYQALARLSPEERERLGGLDGQIAELKSLKLTEKLADLDRRITDVATVQAKLDRVGSVLREGLPDKIAGLLRSKSEAREVARNLGLESFQNPGLSQVGGPLWQTFVRAARDLAHGEGEGYPHPGGPCLLCQQALSEEATGRLQKLWAYLEDDSQSRIQAADRELRGHSAMLEQLELGFLGEHTTAHQTLSNCDQALLQRLLDHLVACREFLTRMLEQLKKEHEEELPRLPSLDPELPRKVLELQNDLQRQRSELAARDVTAEIRKLQEAKTELEDRDRLGGRLEELEKFLADQDWRKKATSAKVMRSTKHITQKYNELFEKLVTQRYLDLFREMLQRLKCPLIVKVKTRGQKGSMQKQLTLEADPSVRIEDTTPQKVLSEGEQRAVALADFFTEVALDEASSGVILDDPVTSLDFQWKETIADYLVEEATKRQVIIFTHDLHFLYCLVSKSEGRVEPACHWIQKRDKPGYVFLHNSPATEKSYTSTAKASEYLERAKKSGPAEEEVWLKQGFGALRTCYEAFVIYELFGSVVLRFEERVSIDRLKDVVIDREVVTEVIDSVGRLSRYIEGHLHSDSYIGEKPEPKLLLKEIDALNALKKKVKESKKALAKK